MPSLQKRLSLMLGGATLLMGMLAGLAAFGLAYQEARELQDDTLRQIAVLYGSSGQGSAKSGKQDHRSLSKAWIDPESRITIVHLPNDSRPAWMVDNLAAGFHTVAGQESPLRVFVLIGTFSDSTVVAQPTEFRNEIALNNALRTLVPSLLFIPVVIWLIIHIVRSQLVPVNQLATLLDRQDAEHVSPLPEQKIPREVLPFVHAINRLLVRISQLLGQQRRFIADAAHELRSPLTALSLQVHNIKQADSLTLAREHILPLEAGVERARRLTEQLLDMARIQASVTERSWVDVEGLARELIEEFVPLATARRIDLGLDVLTKLSLFANPESLRLVLGNGLENALKYTPEGGEVTIRLSMDGGDGFIEIIDNGPGIPDSYRKRVFDPFYRMPDTQGNGSGLGLAIAREAALRMGGQITLHDRPDGVGSIFRYQQQVEPQTH